MTCSLIGQTLTPDLQTDLTQKSWIKSSSVVSHWISFSCVHSAAPRHWWMLLQLNYSPPAGPSSVLIRPLWPTLAEDNCAFVWGRSLHDMDHTAVLCWSSWSGSYCCSLLVFVWKVSPVKLRRCRDSSPQAVFCLRLELHGNSVHVRTCWTDSEWLWIRSMRV